MKCNKCLKIIPKREEVYYKGYVNSDYNKYGVYYCEDCWTQTKVYNKEFKNNDNKQTPSSKNSGYPWYVVFTFTLFIISVGVVFGYFIGWESRGYKYKRKEW